MSERVSERMMATVSQNTDDGDMWSPPQKIESTHAFMYSTWHMFEGTMNDLTMT